MQLSTSVSRLCSAIHHHHPLLPFRTAAFRGGGRRWDGGAQLESVINIWASSRMWAVPQIQISLATHTHTLWILSHVFAANRTSGMEDLQLECEFIRIQPNVAYACVRFFFLRRDIRDGTEQQVRRTGQRSKRRHTQTKKYMPSTHARLDHHQLGI